jgi:hypothetical protein
VEARPATYKIKKIFEKPEMNIFRLISSDTVSDREMSEFITRDCSVEDINNCSMEVLCE